MLLLAILCKYIDSKIKLVNDLHQWFVYQVNKIIKSCNIFIQSFFTEFECDSERCDIFSNNDGIWYQFRTKYGDLTFEEFMNTDHIDTINYIRVSNSLHYPKKKIY